MKKIYIKILLSFILVLISILSISCISENKILAIETETNIIYVGEAVRLKASKNDVIWQSLNSDIAIVSEDGVVTGVSTGNVKITANKEDETAYIDLVVAEETVDPTIVYSGAQTVDVGKNSVITISVLNDSNVIQAIATSNDRTIVTTSLVNTSQNNVFECTLTGVNAGLTYVRITIVGTTTISKDIVVLVQNNQCINSEVDNEVVNKTYEIVGEIDLSSINNKTVELVNKYKDAIIGVSNYQYYQTNPFSSQITLERAGIGTGIIFKKENDANGYKYTVLTNHHVIEDYVALKVYFGYEDIEIDATFIRSESDIDLAIIEFYSEKDIVVAEFGTIDDINVGDFVVAIGNPTGYDYFGSVTFGMVSYKNRELSGEKSVFIQHDAAINPGNSGGPLFNLDGKIIGVNTIKIVDEEVENLGFAISIKTVLKFINVN